MDLPPDLDQLDKENFASREACTPVTGRSQAPDDDRMLFQQ